MTNVSRKMLLFLTTIYCLVRRALFLWSLSGHKIWPSTFSCSFKFVFFFFRKQNLVQFWGSNFYGQTCPQAQQSCGRNDRRKCISIMKGRDVRSCSWLHLFLNTEILLGLEWQTDLLLGGKTRYSFFILDYELFMTATRALRWSGLGDFGENRIFDRFYF